MKNTQQIIGLCAMLTFAVPAFPSQQMFAHTTKPTAFCEFASSGWQSSWKSVIITEIMADPSPPVGLPEIEYIELYNRTGLPIALDGWQFSDAATTVTFGQHVLESHAYLVVTANGSGFVNSNVLMTGNMPSLNNAGDSLLLRDNAGNKIDIVNYSDRWYGDSQRSAGGWSLELIDPDNTCESKGNWTVSDAAAGGTPGEQNSVYASNPDVTPPQLISAHVLDAHKLRMVFSEKLAAGVPSVDQCTIEPSLQMLTASFGDSSRSVVDIYLRDPMHAGVLYKVSVTDVSDCAGNRLAQSGRHSLALPGQAGPGDVVINEILFDPPPNGTDFVELFNASARYIDINGWAIGRRLDDGSLEKRRVEHSLIVAPAGYVAFTADPDVLKSHYTAPDSTLVELRLPAYPDDSGTVVLLSAGDSVMDQVTYSADMHNVFVRDPEGVSLERLSATAAGSDPANWTSAAAQDGYATPGRRNSAHRNASGTGERPVTISPSVFTPLTGQPNFAEIFYHFDKHGYVGTVNIYDHAGRIVRQLANNVTLGAEGSLRWDGDRDDGRRVETGYYLVWFQVFDADGHTRLYREPLAVSPRY